MAKIKIGNVEYEVPNELAPVFEAIRTDAADKMPAPDAFAPKGDMSSLAQKMDTLKGRCEDAVRAWDAEQPLTPPDQLWGGTEP